MQPSVSSADTRRGLKFCLHFSSLRLFGVAEGLWLPMTGKRVRCGSSGLVAALGLHALGPRHVNGWLPRISLCGEGKAKQSCAKLSQRQAGVSIRYDAAAKHAPLEVRLSGIKLQVLVGKALSLLGSHDLSSLPALCEAPHLPPRDI